MIHEIPIKPIICAGEILVDFIAPAGDTLATAKQFAIREGGAPMNAAIALTRLGLPVKFCGAVGNDQFGLRLKALLKREGVDATALRVIKGESTSIAYAWRDKRGDGHFELLRLADRLLTPGDVNIAHASEVSALLVGSVALAASPSREAITSAVAHARELRVPVIFDVNVRPTLWESQSLLIEACEPILGVAKVLKVSLDDARHLWGAESAEDVSKHLGEHFPWLLVITDGARGVSIASARDRTMRHFPAIPVEAIDPTGAGDAFTAALVSRLVRSGWETPNDEDIRFAMAAGALATTREGALTALPTLEELERFLAAQG